MENNFTLYLKDKGFEIKDLLGSGTYGSVYRAYNNRNGEYVAIKRIKPSGKMIPLQNESNFMHTCKSIFTVCYYDNFEVNGETFIIMEYCKHGSLQKLMNKRNGGFDEDTCKNYLAQSLLALEVLHKNKLIHRDLKPDNLFIVDKDQLRIKLGDFGIASRIETVQAVNERAGTSFFMAPEIGKYAYDYKVDVYSLGMMAFYLVEGSNVKYGLSPSRSAEYKNFVEQCTLRNPTLRPTVQQLKRHPLVAEYVEKYENELKQKYWDLDLSIESMDSVESIVIADDTRMTHQSFTILHYPSLQKIEIGKNCFRDVTKFEVRNCPVLILIHVGRNSFKAQESKSGILYIHNNMELQKFTAESLSFQKYNLISRLLDLQKLQQIHLANGVFEGDENIDNFLVLECKHVSLSEIKIFLH